MTPEQEADYDYIIKYIKCMINNKDVLTEQDTKNYFAEEISLQARKEIAKAKYRKLIGAEKTRLQTKRHWFPWSVRLTINRR